MNRIRLFVLSGFLAIGGFPFGSSSAHAQAMSWAPVQAYAYAPSTRYSYWGNSYYAPQWAARGYGTLAPAIRPRHTESPFNPSYNPTGRHDGLARPWLRPLR